MFVKTTNMKLESNNHENYTPLATSDVARALNISPRRVQQLESSGVLTSVRTPSGQRIFSSVQVEQVRLEREARRAQMPAGWPRR